MKRKFLTRTVICLIPTVISALLVVKAYLKDPETLSGFKRGIDLSGGTVLVYEVDHEQTKAINARDDGSAVGARADSALADSIKRRIDENDLKGIVVRALGSRVEIVLPYGGQGSKKAIGQSDVDDVKQQIQQVGSLEFRILANRSDDAAAIGAAEDFMRKAKADPNSDEAKALDAAARAGLPPPFPNRGPSDADAFFVQANDATPSLVQYSWVELSKNERADLGLSTAKPGPGRAGNMFDTFQTARTTNSIVPYGSGAYWSRPAINEKNKAEAEEKKFEYFALTRSSDKDRVLVGGEIKVSAYVSSGKNMEPAVGFSFNSAGASKFYEVTTRNKPAVKDGTTQVMRNLAILLDGRLISAPTLNEAIRDSGQISGNFSRKDVEATVKLLRSGALPATLKKQPVSENTIGPTLGADTIRSGTRSVVLAFSAILIFMMIYYRFAGFVATIALLANLLLTIGFMVAVNATFTLPGLAGLVLMLGMAVDANVLIYERVREERDRGMNLTTALRNGYDRALPTIIDTHLSSIFTAVVLYAVGNDQLKGFGVSLTVGLVISLFTSLYMTRLIFDFWQEKNWLSQLRMLRFFSKPNINFMGIRKQMFAATFIMTIIGIGLFLARGKQGLNVDFVGGTAYSGRLAEPLDIGTLREKLGEKGQKDRLTITNVRETDAGRNTYELTYADGQTTLVALANSPEGSNPEARAANVKARASELRDWSVEQIFTSESSGDKSPIFTVRTTEREPEIVQASVNRLMADGNKSLLATTTAKVSKVKDEYVFTFESPVSKSLMSTFVERQLQARMGTEYLAAETFDIVEMGEAKDGRYGEMKVTINKDVNGGIQVLTTKEKDGSVPLDKVMQEVATAFSSRPQPERLETFDGTLASETRSRALYAILASWAAILLYLWFRFGNWTFGAAAVICLIHDLCFTLGMIALCHYLHDTFLGPLLGLQDFKIDLPAIAALLTLVGYSVNDTIVVFDRIKEVRGKSPVLTSQMINDSVNQTLSRTVLASFTTFLVVIVLYMFGGEGVHLFAFVMVIGVLVGTYSSIYIASPLLLIFGEGKAKPIAGAPAISGAV